MGGKAMQGAGDMSQLLQGAWNEASGGGEGGSEGGDAGMDGSDPATSKPPNTDMPAQGDNEGSGANVANSETESAPSNEAAPQAAPSSMPNSDNSSTTNSGETAPSDTQGQTNPKGFTSTAAAAAGIASRAVGHQLKGSAKNAFKAGMGKFAAPFTTPSNSALGRAAQSLKPKVTPSNPPNNQE